MQTVVIGAGAAAERWVSPPDKEYLDPCVVVRTPTRWQVRMTGRTAENAANLRKGDRLLVTGSVVTDSWAYKQTDEIRYTTRVLAQSVGVSLTFARVSGIQRNTRAEA